MSMSAAAAGLEEFRSVLEEMAVKRAEVIIAFQEKKREIAAAPMSGNVIEMRDGKIIHPTRGVAPFNPRMQSVNEVTSGLGFQGERHPLPKKDILRWYRAHMKYNVCLNSVPPERIPNISAYINTIDALMATFSTTRETMSGPEFLKTPEFALPSAQQMQRQPQQEQEVIRRRVE